MVRAAPSRIRVMGEPSARHRQRRLAGLENVGAIKEQFVKERKRISDQLMSTMTPEFVKNIERSKGQMQNANNAQSSQNKTGSAKDIIGNDLFSTDESSFSLQLVI